MFKNYQLGIIGGGVMAESIVKGLIEKELFQPSQIICSTPRPERLDELASSYQIQTTVDNEKTAQKSDILLLAVKPQVVHKIFDQLKGKVSHLQFVMSILAGTNIAPIQEGLSFDNVIRVMPNTPAQIGQAMSVWTATTHANREQREMAKLILEALGKAVYVQDENQMDMATALSGSGPAYIFLFLEALTDAGVHLGFSRRVAKELILQTMKGSVEFAQESPRHFAELKNMVTSPGGTTAEALYQMEKGGLRTMVSKAVFAAFKRSQDLDSSPQSSP